MLAAALLSTSSALLPSQGSRPSRQRPALEILMEIELERQPGKRRLETRDEIRSLPPGTKGRITSLLDTRVRSALRNGRVLLPEQPAHLRTGLSSAELLARMAVVERHFSFAPLDAAAEAALAAELAEVGASLAQGYGLRNQLYRERQAAGRARLDEHRHSLPPPERLAEGAAALGAAPLDLLRALLAAPKHDRFGSTKLSPRLAGAAAEAIVEASASGQELTLRRVLATRRLRKLRYEPRRAVQARLRAFEAATPDFWAAAAHACAHDVQGATLKHVAQRPSRAAERLTLRRLRDAGVQGRSEAQLQRRTTTPDFVVDGGPGANSPGLRWVDVKHTVGCGDPARLAAQLVRYSEDWGPGAVVFTLGYAEEFADALRAAVPGTWVLDVPAGESILIDGFVDVTTLQGGAPKSTEHRIVVTE